MSDLNVQSRWDNVRQEFGRQRLQNQARSGVGQKVQTCLRNSKNSQVDFGCRTSPEIRQTVSGESKTWNQISETDSRESAPVAVVPKAKPKIFQTLSGISALTVTDVSRRFLLPW